MMRVESKKEEHRGMRSGDWGYGEKSCRILWAIIKTMTFILGERALQGIRPRMDIIVCMLLNDPLCCHVENKP